MRSRVSYQATEEEVGEDLYGMTLVRQEQDSLDVLKESLANGAQDVLRDHLHYERGGPVVCFSVRRRKES